MRDLPIESAFGGRADGEWTKLLHPANGYSHPSEVVRDLDLTINEKRAILASWASDACAVEAVPSMRQLASGRAVKFDDIMDCLRSLDALAQKGLESSPKYERWIRQSDVV
jgi:hypothetical protein